MNLADEIEIDAPRARVYEALNDPEILRRCIPGCETLEASSDDEFAARVVLKVGPVKAGFDGAVTLDRTGAPDRFALSGQGAGGVAGHAKGGAEVTLEDLGGGRTLLRYDAKAEVGGKIAQLGSRLIQSTAKKLSAKFFASFAEVLAEERVG